MLLARSGQLGVKTPRRPSHSGNPHICEFYQQQLTLALSDFFREKSLRASGRRWQKGIIWEHSRAAIPRLFGTRDQFRGRQVFQGLHGGEMGGSSFGIQMHYIYCAFYLYYYISSTSDHQALDPRGWGALPTALCS